MGLYVAQSQPATVQLGGLYTPWINPDENVLVVNKLTRLEVFALSSPSSSTTSTQPALTLLHEIPLFGTVASLTAATLHGRTTSTLIVLTTSHHLFALDYSHASGITTSSTTSIAEPHARTAELQKVVVDPRARCVVVHAFDGILHVVPIGLGGAKKGKGKRRRSSAAAVAVDETAELDLERGFNVRLDALNVDDLVPLDLPPLHRPTRKSRGGDEEDDPDLEGEDDDDEGDAEDELEPTPPVVVTISSDHNGAKKLSAFAVDLLDKELSPLEGVLRGKEGVKVRDPGVERLIPVGGGEEGWGGVVTVGEEWVEWVEIRELDEGSKEGKKSKGKGKGKARGKEEEQKRVGVRMPVGMVQAWAKVPGEDDVFLLGDVYGKLMVLVLVREGGKVERLELTDLGDTSSPTAIIPLSSSLIYITSRFADSQLVKLPISAIRTGDERMGVEDEDEMELVASYASLAPVLDAVLVKKDGGSVSLVTCSGAYKGGSLRVVRSEVGLSEEASLDIEGIREMWSLRRGTDDLLVLSFFTETRVLSFTKGLDGEEGGVEEVDAVAVFAAELPTILAASVGGLLVQVTAAGVRFVNEEEEMVQEWKGESRKKITLATTVGDMVVLAVEGGVVVLLEVRGEKLVQVGSSQLPNEVASLYACTISSTPILVVGLWTSQTVLLLSLPSLRTISFVTLDSTFLIRSVLITTFADGVSQLFVGLGDGSLSSFVVERSGEGFRVDEASKKEVTLGSLPIAFREFVAAGVVSVLVMSDRPTIVSREGDRLKYSSVNLKGITAATSFSSHSSVYPSSLALASPTSLRIGRIEEIQRVDIRTIPLDEDEPARIAHDAREERFGVLCLRREIDRSSGVETTMAAFKVFDEKTFGVLGSFPLEPNEEGQSVAVVPRQSYDGGSYFVVGTTRIDPHETEPTGGRLLLFAAVDGGVKQVGEAKIGGAPYAIATLEGDGYFAAAVNSQVIAYSIDRHHAITPVSTWSGAFISHNLVACPSSTLLVGDAMRSMTLLRFNSDPTPVLEEVARDYRALYMSAVEALVGDGGGAGSEEKKEYIGAETELNLFTVLKENVTTSRSMSDEEQLSPRGVFHLGEMVSKFCRGSFVQQLGDSSSAVAPRLVFATSAGSIGVIAEVDAEGSKLLTELERNLRTIVPAVGGLDHEQ
ncbi:DNA damage-binding protein 1 [Pseudohyphozyma bogoriensis]|nr:DNA damage-binding protein 1 [Pseudohyphozyma bogoriensis]